MTGQYGFRPQPGDAQKLLHKQRDPELDKLHDLLYIVIEEWRHSEGLDGQNIRHGWQGDNYRWYIVGNPAYDHSFYTGSGSGVGLDSYGSYWKTIHIEEKLPDISVNAVFIGSSTTVNHLEVRVTLGNQGDLVIAALQRVTGLSVFTQ
jgi:hypothetical protein